MYVCDMTHSCVWHDTYTLRVRCVTWHTDACDSIMHATRLIHESPSHVCSHVWVICVTHWYLHMWVICVPHRYVHVCEQHIGVLHSMRAIRRQCVLQCVAVRCSVLQCVAMCCSVLQGVAGCCRVFQCVAVCCAVLQQNNCLTATHYNTLHHTTRQVCFIACNQTYSMRDMTHWYAWHDSHTPSCRRDMTRPTRWYKI